MNLEEYLIYSVIELKRHNTQQKLPYCCMEEFVLRFGKSYRNQPLPSLFKCGRIQKCFRNARLLANSYSDNFIYTEGFSTVHNDDGRAIACHLHAWCIDKAGYVYDNTWTYTSEREYFGIPFKLDYVNKVYKQTKLDGLIDRYEEGWPLFFMNPEEFIAT